MGNNKAVFILVGVFGFFILILIFIGLLSKFKSTNTDVSVTPTIAINQAPFKGSTFNSSGTVNDRENVKLIKTEAVIINKASIESKLPIITDTFEVSIDPTSGQVTVLLKGNEVAQSEQDFKKYILDNNLNLNGTSVSIQYSQPINGTTPTSIITQAVSVVPTTPPEDNVAGTSGTQNSTGGVINSFMEIFKQQRATIQGTTVAPTSSQPQTIPNTGTTSTSNNTSQQQNTLTEKFLSIFSNIINNINSKSPTPTPSLLPTPIGNANDNGGHPIDASPISSTIFSDYGLPQPVSSGQYGYLNQLNRIKSNSTIKWNVENLLNGEKIAKSKGINVKPYITTGWIWFENGAAGYPDVYEINCNDNRKGFSSEVSVPCSVSNFQIAGYQARTRASDYKQIFNKLYSESQLVSVMQTVVNNSSNAADSKWNYLSSSQQNKGLMQNLQGNTIPSNMSLSLIASNTTDFANSEKQFFTLILGKDPAMAVSLNSVAVSDSDLIHCLKTSASCYGYIGSAEKQVLANIIAALIIYDKGSLP